jgi:NADH-quinone oxidoreductase subunit M
MFNHGLTTAAMFLLMACLIARRGNTRWDEGSHGLASQFPRLALFLVFFVVAGAGMPGLNNFVGELLALAAMISVYPVLTAIASLGIVLGAWYSFRMIQNILFGPYEAGKRAEATTAALVARDLSGGQKVVFTALAAVSLVIGIVPMRAIDLFEDDVQRIAKVSHDANAALMQPLDVSAIDRAAPVSVRLTSTR